MSTLVKATRLQTSGPSTTAHMVETINKYKVIRSLFKNIGNEEILFYLNLWLVDGNTYIKSIFGE